MTARQEEEKAIRDWAAANQVSLPIGMMPANQATAVKAKAAWGARALFRQGTGPPAYGPQIIDLLWDRQDMLGPEPERLELQEWIDSKGLPALRQAVEDMNLQTTSTETVTIKDGKFRMKASPKRSHGYLYIGAWME